MTDRDAAGKAADDESRSARSNATFQFFPKLPLELRLKIWRLIFPAPRIIKNVSVHFWGTWDGQPYAVRYPRAQNPVTLFVNHESRTETQHTYHDLSELLEICKQPVYFSPEHDAIHLGPIMPFTRTGNWVRHREEDVAVVIAKLSHIQILILDGLYINEPRQASWATSRGAQYGNPDTHERIGETLAKFHCLKKLFLVLAGASWKYEVSRGATLESSEDFFRSCFEIERLEWPECNIPEVEMVLPGNSLAWNEESD